MKECVKFRGSREGLTVVLDPGVAFEVLVARLKEKLAAANGFLAGSAVCVDVGPRDLQPDQLQVLEEVFREHDLRLRRILAGPERGASARGVGRVAPEVARQVEEKPGVSSPGRGSARDEIPVACFTVGPRIPRADIVSEEQTILVQRTVRSGQRIFYPGNVVILGDVNPGAEVVAGGHIIVMGTFRGVAHAGAFGNEKAVVAAFRLEPTQLRIASYITRAPEGDFSSFQQPEIARVQDGIIVIEKYQPGFDRILGRQGKGGS